ncbi:MAG: FIST C-terminal domain-containing protein [Bacteroidales bacterium]|nr:FIST C-terminal domain-containing protein [Bacteroidales bacterium]
MGGVFPYIISQGDLKEQGVIINRIPGGGKCFFLEGPEPSMEEVAPMVDYIHEFKPETAFIFADGMSRYNSGIISSVYRYLGTSVRYFGAGAGTMDYVQKPVVFCSEGLISNGVTIMFSGREMHMSVKHGWEKYKGPLMITQAEGNVIHKLNWQNAFEVYRRELGKEAAKMTPQSFGKWGQKHPLGFDREDSDIIIRNPFAAKSDGSLVCVGDVSDNALVHIMRSDKELLKAAAVESAKESLTAAGKNGMMIIFNCLARKHFLGEDIKEELKAIEALYRQYPFREEVNGALTLGAFASLPQDIWSFLPNRY